MKELILLLIISTALTGCAVGSATSALSLKALTADNLSAEAEQKIVDRTKKEIINEIQKKE